MFAQLQVVGTGMDGDDYRVDLPSYSTVAIDYAEMVAIVSFSNRVGPPQLPPSGAPYWQTINGMNVLVGLPDEMLTAWWARLAQSYASRFPPYQPAFPLS